jgi:outer membrane lipoprotein-sorting protein
MKLCSLTCLVLFVIGVAYAADVEVSAERMIDLSNQYVTEFTVYEFTNTAKQAQLKQVDIAIETKGLSYWIVDGSSEKGAKEIQPLKSTERTETRNDIE